MALTPKRQRFVEEYLVDLNATQAATRAGYSPATARQMASRLLTNVDIQAAVAEVVAKRSEDTGITVEWVLDGLRQVADRCLQIEEVTTREGEGTGEFVFNAAGANKAFELIGKYLRMFAERTEHTGAQGGPITFTIIRDDND